MSADGSRIEVPQAEPPRGFNLSALGDRARQLHRLSLVLLLAAGGYAFFTLGQKEDPDFTFRLMVVQVLWPGASVEEMQEQVVDKIERKLQETPGLDFLRSYTRPGFANIFVNLRGSVRGEAVADAFYQVRKKVGDIRHTLPEGVIGPFFNDEFGDTYMSLYAVTGQGYSYPELKDVRQERSRHPAAHPRRRQGRPPGHAGGAHLHRDFLRRRWPSAGSPRSTSRPRWPARTPWTPPAASRPASARCASTCEGGLKSVEDIRELRLRAGQQVFRLGDIAEVKRALEDPPTAKTRYQGREAVLLGATMAPGDNVTVVGAAVEQRAEAHRARPAGRRRARQDLRPGPGRQQVGPASSCARWPRRSASCSSCRSSRSAGAPASSSR